MIRARFCPEHTEIHKLRCIDDRAETDQRYGSQLWYFEGLGVDERNVTRNVFGAVEYSMQYGLHELIEDGVFRSEDERDRFRCVYEREIQRPSYPSAKHHWFAFSVVSVAAVWLTCMLVQTLLA